jgi:hypothetical protein
MSAFEQQLMKRLEEYALRIIWHRCSANSSCDQGPLSGQITLRLSAHSLADKTARQQICLKELEETGYWLQLLYKAQLLPIARLEPLSAETSDLTAIFVASVRKLQRKP